MNEISIIVPVYSIKETYLRRCIESIIYQSFSSLDILLIDDGSPDNCGNICDEYAKQDNRIQVVHQTNQGVSVARNVGINHAKGDWIMFVDADDWLDKKVCEEVFNKANEHKPDILNFGYSVFNEKINVLESKILGNNRLICFTKKDKRKIIENVLLYKTSLSPLYLSVPWGKLIRKDFLIENNIYFVPKLARMQDLIHSLYLFEHANTIEYYDYNGYVYNRNDSSVCNKYSVNISDVLEKVLSELWIFINKYYPNQQYLLSGMAYSSIFVYLKLFLLHKDNSSLNFFAQCRLITKFVNIPVLKKALKYTPFSFVIYHKRVSWFFIYLKWYHLLIFKQRLFNEK